MKTKVNETNRVDYIMMYESGELNDEDTLHFFSHLIQNGMAWSLQGHYGRTARALIDDEWIDKVGKQPEGSAEQALLDYEVLSKDNSRLSCQVILDESMDGLTVHIPK